MASRDTPAKRPKKRPAFEGGHPDQSDFCRDPKWQADRVALIESARKGDTHAARELLQVAASALETEAPLPLELRDYLRDVLWVIFGSGDANLAFGLVGRRGQPPSPDRDLALVALVELELRRIRQEAGQRRDGDLVLARKAALQKMFDQGIELDERTLKNALNRFGKLSARGVDPIAQLSDAELSALADLTAVFPEAKPSTDE